MLWHVATVSAIYRQGKGKNKHSAKGHLESHLRYLRKKDSKETKSKNTVKETEEKVDVSAEEKGSDEKAPATAYGM